VLRFSRALELRIKLQEEFQVELQAQGGDPLEPLLRTACFILPRGQSSCRGFGRVFGRAFAELRMEVRAELLYAFAELW
jgi:hypothetical protein